MKFMVRFECALCGKTSELFTDVTIDVSCDTDSMGNKSYEYELVASPPEEWTANRGWKTTYKCEAC